LLRRHVRDRAHRGAGLGQLRVEGKRQLSGLTVWSGIAQHRRNLSQAKVENLGMATLGHEEVGGLDVAMDDSRGMCRLKSVGNLDGDGQKNVRFHGTPRHSVFQCQPVQKLHGDERLARVLSNLVNGADVGMIQRGGRAGFPAEAFQCLRVLCPVFGKEFQRREAAEFRVFRLVHHAHPATAKLLDDAVMRDGLANQFLADQF
jgi:hypothetical protein